MLTAEMLDLVKSHFERILRSELGFRALFFTSCPANANQNTLSLQSQCISILVFT